MGKCIDISSKLDNTKPTIKIAEGKEYEVNTSVAVVLKVNQMLENGGSEIELIMDALKLILGKKAIDEISKMDLSMSAFKTLFTGVMACVSDISYEDAAARFQ